MTGEPLPPHLPRYCMLCGASLNYTEISTVDGEGSASWKCSGCGKEDTDNWSEFTFTAVDQTDQSLPDIEFTPPSPDYLFMLPPPPPPPPPLSPGSLATPPTPSYFDNPEDARIVQEQFERDFQEQHKQYEALSRLIEADGVVAIVRAAHFPLFALNGLQGRFPFQSHGWGGGWSPGKTPRMLTSFSLKYEGPSYPNVTERIDIKQEDEENSPSLNLITDELQEFDAYDIVRLLAGLPVGEEPDMLALWDGMAIYQYVNIETARQTPVVRASIQLQSGEVASWMIRRFNAPIPLVHARAHIEGTRCDVGAIGRAAEEIVDLLGQLTRLTPESPALEQIKLGLKAWDGYFKRGFQS